MICPRCSQQMLAVQYGSDHPAHYDGVSEWRCLACLVRIGRWSGKELAEGEVEYRSGPRKEGKSAERT